MAFHGVKQAEMAKAINISQSQLSKILRADRSIDLETFEAFSEYLGEDAASLVAEGQVLVGERIAESSEAAGEHQSSGIPADFDSWSADDKADYIAANPEKFDLAAKHGDTEAEQEAYEQLP